MLVLHFKCRATAASMQKVRAGGPLKPGHPPLDITKTNDVL